MIKLCNLRRKLCDKYGERFSICTEQDNDSPAMVEFKGESARQDLMNYLYKTLLVGDDFTCESVIEDFEKRTGLQVKDGKVAYKPKAIFG